MAIAYLVVISTVLVLCVVVFVVVVVESAARVMLAFQHHDFDVAVHAGIALASGKKMKDRLPASSIKFGVAQCFIGS